MKATIDKSGRIVIPKKIRAAAGFTPGTTVEIHYRNGIIEIEPEPLPVRLERRGSLLVAVPLVPVEPLTDEMVQPTLDAIRDERMVEFLGEPLGEPRRRRDSRSTRSDKVAREP
ncbi:MAG: AbrB/MazE/SpoVT family DNA-binding domain-containing protein [Dehalococcoidia bacterium]